ncbi:hypothetical protein LCI23_03245 [Massilia sp. MS-15]|nr:hypothetical protein [Massilia sp. MS-15]
MQWLQLPARAPREDALPVPAPEKLPGSQPPLKRPAQPGPARAARTDALPVAPAGSPAGPSDPGLVPEAPTAPAPPAAPAQNARAILETAVRSAGAIDRALRKESKPLIIAPPDSPTLRMREGMEQARALAPTRLWEAPKVEELVNNTGDGARRTRVVTGRGTYCVTERSPVTNVEMIEMHGKIRLTSCPRDETPAKAQVWRTARD